MRERILRVAGNPADFGAPEPSADLPAAGLALCQGWLTQVRDGDIGCRPEIASVAGREVTFVDGSTERIDAIVCAVGYDVDIPCLAMTCSARTSRCTSERSTRRCRGLASSPSSSPTARTSRCSRSRPAG